MKPFRKIGVLLCFVVFILLVRVSFRTTPDERYGSPHAGKKDTLVMAVRPNSNDCYLYRSEVVGFHLELVRACTHAHSQVYRIYYETDEKKRWQALLQGEVTILVCSSDDSLLLQYHKERKVFHSPSLEAHSNSVWVVNEENRRLLVNLNKWIVYYLSTPEYEIKRQRYFVLRNPDNIKPQTELSVYDRIIKRCAERLNWDWRLLASLIYQESRFQHEALSHRGAYGLMQIIPATAEHYRLHDMETPEDNIEAGTKILHYLQRDLASDTASVYDNKCFILAAYNAGKGRIDQCRRFAVLQEKNQYKWSEVASVIPLMKHPVYYENEENNISRFKGAETLNYVEKIMDRYELYKVLLPE